jgi:hypothetical protein
MSYSDNVAEHKIRPGVFVINYNVSINAKASVILREKCGLSERKSPPQFLYVYLA